MKPAMWNPVGILDLVGTLCPSISNKMLHPNATNIHNHGLISIFPKLVYNFAIEGYDAWNRLNVLKVILSNEKA